MKQLEMKNIPAAGEDAKDEEQKIPKAGDVLTEQDAFFFKNCRHIIEELARHLLEERKQKDQVLQESAGHKQRADEMSEEIRLVRADNRRKDEIINRKDEVITRKDEELTRMRAENERIRAEGDQKDAKLKEILAEYQTISESAAYLAQRYNPNKWKDKSPDCLPQISESASTCLTIDKKICTAIMTMQAEKQFRHAYDYAWIMLVMNQTRELPHFDSVSSYHSFLVRIGVANLPSLSSVEKKTAMACRQHPAWTFTDTADTNETRRRNNVASRFLSLVRKLN